MYKYIYAIIIYCSLYNTLHAQDAMQRLQNILNANQSANTVEIIRPVQYDKLRTPQSEVEDAVLFLSKLPESEVQYIKFFSTYAILPKYREKAVLTLSFIVHSTCGVSLTEENSGGFYPLAMMVDGKFIDYRRVPNSDTLWWIDVRDYNWTPQAWEIVSSGDPYFVEPIVTHQTSGALRLLSGNAVLRADWFVFHVMNTTTQQDIGVQQDYYRTLLYAKNKIPTTLDEFRSIWGLDINKSRKFGVEFGTLVTKSRAVAKGNRMLFGYRTPFGHLYETYDVNFQAGRRDYLESIFSNKRIGGPPDISDAGEIFGNNQRGLLVYDLVDRRTNKLVNFGDPTVVRHMNDMVGDARVRVAHSCADCHASGPIPAENTMSEFIESYGKLKTYEKRDALRLQSNILSKKFEESIQENQALVARAIKKCNGLTPAENGSAYSTLIQNYNKNITLEIAAYECGVTPDEFKEAILNSKYRFGARLKLLVTTGETIPREVWEAPSIDGIPGAFQQAMIMLNGVTIINEEVLEEKYVKVFEVKDYIDSAPIQIGKKVLVRLNAGDRVLPTGKIVDYYWLGVKTQSGIYGYIANKYVKEISVPIEEAVSLFGSINNEE